MTSNELKQLRQLLFLEVAEAAKWIGNCEPRTWQRWEKGDRSIPPDVAQEMKMLACTRQEMLAVEFDPDDPNYRYFASHEEFAALIGNKNPVKWRLAQSVGAALYAELSADEWRNEETIEGGFGGSLATLERYNLL